MPRSQRTASLPPVPIAILPPPTEAAAIDEYGLYPQVMARLIATYTHPGDTVVDLDHTGTITDSAPWLGRRAGDDRQPAALVIVRLPKSDDLPGTRFPARRWRACLAPGGFLVVATTAAGARDHATGLVAAVRAVGLRYQQHLVSVVRALPVGEPRAEEATAADAGAGSVLVGGRHRPTHASLFVFARDGGDRV